MKFAQKHQLQKWQNLDTLEISLGIPVQINFRRYWGAQCGGA
jgi:hypothetical protein